MEEPTLAFTCGNLSASASRVLSHLNQLHLDTRLIPDYDIKQLHSKRHCPSPGHLGVPHQTSGKETNENQVTDLVGDSSSPVCLSFAYRQPGYDAD